MRPPLTVTIAARALRIGSTSHPISGARVLAEMAAVSSRRANAHALLTAFAAPRWRPPTEAYPSSPRCPRARMPSSFRVETDSSSVMSGGKREATAACSLSVAPLLTESLNASLMPVSLFCHRLDAEPLSRIACKFEWAAQSEQLKFTEFGPREFESHCEYIKAAETCGDSLRRGEQ